MASKGRKRGRQRPWQSGEQRAPQDPGPQRARECTSKVAHDNRTSAEQAALEHEHRFGEAKDAYRCRFCGRWHVGTTR